MARKNYFTDAQGVIQFLSLHDLGKRYRMCIIKTINLPYHFYVFDTKKKKRLFNKTPLCLDHETINEKCIELNNYYEDDLNYLKEIKIYTNTNDNKSNNNWSR